MPAKSSVTPLSTATLNNSFKISSGEVLSLGTATIEHAFYQKPQESKYYTSYEINAWSLVKQSYPAARQMSTTS